MDLAEVSLSGLMVLGSVRLMVALCALDMRTRPDLHNDTDGMYWLSVY